MLNRREFLKSLVKAFACTPFLFNILPVGRTQDVANKWKSSDVLKSGKIGQIDSFAIYETPIGTYGTSIPKMMQTHQERMNEALDIAAKHLAEAIDRDILNDIYREARIKRPRLFRRRV